MTEHATLSEDSLRFLRSREDRYPYAFGYLTSTIHAYLDGATGRERLADVLTALETELRGERQ
jgi:hypothetical protein